MMRTARVVASHRRDGGALRLHPAGLRWCHHDAL